MKTDTHTPVYKIFPQYLLLLFVLCWATPGNAQGRVLINEYLPWPNNACGVTAEFIELYNFGPGPMNIGCYIITDGDFSITIPPNTILLPGQFYVLAGQSTIPQNCGNDLRNVTVDLNWATCGCTSGTIPTTGDGLMTDGGSANEQIVLLDPNLKIIDAVIRDFPAETSSPITTSSMSGQCTSLSFDLDTMNVQYETIGESTGRGNSMARKLDGGCDWLKDTQESAGDPNNTPGSGSELDAALIITDGQACPDSGSVRVDILSGNYSQIFPVTYTLGLDADSNSIYNFSDIYLNGVDSSANTIPITGLAAGRYQLAIGTQLGCDLTQFDFVILGCNDIILSQRFLYFKAINENEKQIKLVWDVADRELAGSFDIELSRNGIDFSRHSTINNITGDAYKNGFYYTVNPINGINYYRIRLTGRQGKVTYSAIEKAGGPGEQPKPVMVFPNPVHDQLTIQITSGQIHNSRIAMYDKFGRVIKTISLLLQKGENVYTFHTSSLPAGIYYLGILSPQALTGQNIKIVKGR